VKYAAIITSGLAEPALPPADPDASDDHELNRSPLRDAPALQRLAAAGRVGRVAALPPDAAPAFGAALAALLGVDTQETPVDEEDLLRASRGERAVALQPFKETHGLTASLVSADPASLGLARLLGMTPVRPESSTPSARDLAAIAEAELETAGVVVVALPDLTPGPEAGAELDGGLVAPLATALGLGEGFDPAAGPGARLLLVALPAAESPEPRAPAPFLLAGDWVRSAVTRPFTEPGAARADLLVDPGCDLMEYVLYSGIKRTVVRPRAKLATANPARRQRLANRNAP